MTTCPKVGQKGGSYARIDDDIASESRTEEKATRRAQREAELAAKQRDQTRSAVTVSREDAFRNLADGSPLSHQPVARR
jgi:hypothetical protein